MSRHHSSLARQAAASLADVSKLGPASTTNDRGGNTQWKQRAYYNREEPTRLCRAAARFAEFPRPPFGPLPGTLELADFTFFNRRDA